MWISTAIEALALVACYDLEKVERARIVWLEQILKPYGTAFDFWSSDSSAV